MSLWLNVDSKNEIEIKGFCRDITDIGHFSTGNYETSIRNSENFEKAKEYIAKAYYEN